MIRDNVELEQVQIKLVQSIKRHNLKNVSCTVGIDSPHDMMVLCLKATMYGERVMSETIQYPRDWWQAFKDRWFPQWAQRRWPVEWTAKTFDFKCVYPDFEPAMEPHAIIVSESFSRANST